MPRLIDILRLRARSLFRRSAVDRDLNRELRFHLEERVKELVAEGRTPDEARCAAAREFGSTASIEQQCREHRRVGFVANLVQDLRYACRILRREPVLVMAATLSIALGVGVNLAIVGVANRLVFNTPTAANPGRLVNIRLFNGSHVSYPVWRDLHESGVLAGIAGRMFETEINWRAGDQSIRITPLIVTANYFDVLGVPMEAGRGFSAFEAAAERDPRLVVLGHTFWRTRLNGDPSMVGGTLVLNGEPYTVTGVQGRGVRPATGMGVEPDIYIPISRRLVGSLDRVEAGHVQLFGRLKDGQTLLEGRTALAVIVARIGAAARSEGLATIRDFGPLGGIDQGRDFREITFFFLALLVVTMLVLAIACANVAGLLLARSTARAREIGIRLALGASRPRLIQQLLTEGLLLSCLGVAAGLLVAAALGRALAQVSLPVPVPIVLGVEFDDRLLWLSLALVVISTLLSGLTPALQATRREVVPSLKQETASYVHRRLTLRSLIVTGQVAISVLLVVVTFLFGRNLGLAHTMNPGFRTAGTVAAEITFVEGRQGTAGAPAVAAMVERVRALPGVTAAAFTGGVPLTPSGFNLVGTRVRIEGKAGEVRVDYSMNSVGPGYFAALGIPMQYGREFTAADRAGAPRALVINEEFARRYFEKANPVGLHIDLPIASGQVSPAEVVGVAANAKYRTIGEDREPAIYEAYLQRGGVQRQAFVIAAGEGSVETTVRAVRAALLQVDPMAAVDAQPLQSMLEFAFVPSRIGAATMGALGLLGALLAMVGLYGIVAFNVARRGPEIAIRMALGASRDRVVRLMLADTAWLAGIGIAAGLALAFIATPLLSSFLVAELSPKDPLSFLATALLLAGTSLAAAWRPARRAVRVEPAAALRAE